MAPNDHLLQSLCRDPETLAEARVVLRLAQKKTGPGSGHELGPHTTGLPAICAHIASKKLNNGDLSRKNAQLASCLKASDFEKAFHIVQAAIADSRGRPGTNETYESLVKKYLPPVDRDRLFSWLRAAERTLLQSSRGVDLEDSSVKCAVFYWVCAALTGKNITTVQAFAEDNEIPQKSMTRLVEKVGTTCVSLKARIQDENKAKRSSPTKTTATPRKSPTKPPLRALPSRDSPQKRKLTSATSLDQVESDADTLDMLVPETPTKRRRAETSPTKPSGRISPLKPIFPPIPSSSRVTLDTLQDVEMTTVSELQPTHSQTSTPRRAQRTKSTEQKLVADSPMEVDVPAPPLFSEDEVDDAEPPPRRFRPVYLDHKQWYSRDSRLNRIWKQGEKYKQNMVELYGHPLEHLRSSTMDH